METKSKSKIKHFLILCARVLALASIILAFAQPFIPTGDNVAKTGVKTVGLYIDNSFSMESESESGNVLEIAKNKALEIVKYHSPTDVFQLITNDFEGKNQRWLTQEEITELIPEIDFSAQSRKVTDVYARHRDLAEKEESDKHIIYVLSDLQKSVTDIAGLSLDSSYAVQFVPTPSAYAENLFIDSVWFSSPSRNLNTVENLHVSIGNTLNSPRENVPVKLFINGTQKSILSIDLLPGVFTDTVLTYTNSSPGFKNARIQIEDYPVVFDDEYFLGYNVSEKTKVLEISANVNQIFSNLFKNEAEYDFSKFNQNQVDYNRFPEFDLIIVNQLTLISSGLRQELNKFAQAGGNLVIIPSIDADISSYNGLLSARKADLLSGVKNAELKVSRLNTDHFIYKDVFDETSRNMPLPKVSSYFSSTGSSTTNRDELVTLQNGAPFLSCFENGNSYIYLFHTSLNAGQTDLASHSLLVYTLHSIANNARASSKPFFELGEEDAFTLKSAADGGAETIIKMKSAEGDEFIPEFRRREGRFDIFPGENASLSGNYDILSEDETIGVIGVNYNRAESLIDYYDAYDLKQELMKLGLENYTSVITSDLNTIAASIQEVNEGKTLWKSFIIMALLFLGIEILLIKFWK